MALNFPPNPSNLQQYTDDNGIVWEFLSSKSVWNVLSSEKLKEFSGVKLVLDMQDSLTTSLSSVSWDSANYDIGGYYNSSFPTRLTIPKIGFYRVNLLVSVGPLGSGASYTLIVRKNGTTNLTTTTAGANQFVSYDEILQLYEGDYIELYALETEGIGSINVGSFLEAQNVGDQIGSAQSEATTFSGLKANINVAEALTSSLAAITWDSTVFNTNADINGNVYWTISDPSKESIYTPGYYRIKASFEAGSTGTDDSYSVQLRFDNVPVISASMSPNGSLDIDDVYNLNSGSYIQFFAAESGEVGELTTDSYLEIIRLGV
jgi:hypothetical protein